jgi:hypothetical protein
MGQWMREAAIREREDWHPLLASGERLGPDRVAYTRLLLLSVTVLILWMGSMGFVGSACKLPKTHGIELDAARANEFAGAESFHLAFSWQDGFFGASVAGSGAFHFVVFFRCCLSFQVVLLIGRASSPERFMLGPPKTIHPFP